jgi:hypothetical protein
LLLFAVADRMAYPLREQLHVPATPLDRTNLLAAHQWDFLQRSRPLIPAGASLTVRAPDAASENALYMMALGVFAANPVWPSSYFGVPAEDGARAEYLISYRTPPSEPRLEVIGKWGDGAVYRRRRP